MISKCFHKSNSLFLTLNSCYLFYVSFRWLYPPHMHQRFGQLIGLRVNRPRLSRNSEATRLNTTYAVMSHTLMTTTPNVKNK